MLHRLVRLRVAICLVCPPICGLVLLATPTPGAEDAAKSVLKVQDQKQFFADDLLIAAQSNIERRLHQAKKHPNSPILRPEQPWENGNLSAGRVVRREDGTLEMTYVTFLGKLHNFKRDKCLAISNDGLNWTRPNLGLVEFRNSKENNLMPANRSGVLDHHETNPARRYKAVFTGGPTGVSVTFSPDGVQWTDFSGNPVLKDAHDTHTVFGWDPNHQQYVGYFRPKWNSSKRASRVIGRSTSPDFEKWTDIQTILEPDELDPPGTEFYWISVSLVDGMYWGNLAILKLNEKREESPATFLGNDNTMFMQTVFSRDGIHWERPGDRQPLIALGAPGSWDECYAITMAGVPIIMQDEEWYYYLGTNFRHTLKNPYPQVSSVVNGRLIGGQIGLATLRLDGRVSLHAGDKEGSITTPPLQFTGKQLNLNCVTGKQGAVRVEIQDAAGKPIPGFTLQDCQPLRGDAVRQTVSWKGGDVSRLTKEPVRVRFVMQDADLYTFQFR